MPASPTAHLSPDQIEEFGRELDAIREEVLATRGERDAAYIKKVIRAQRGLEAGGRAALLVSLFPPAWVAGTTMLSAAKIIENMEIGHNVLHGQWDWMRDPQIHSTTWEWDTVISAEGWKHTHNDVHHRWTNVVGKDRDVGYTLIRMSDDQPWTRANLLQPLWNALLAPVFDWGIALYDLELDEMQAGRKSAAKVRAQVKTMAKKVMKQSAKDFVVWPLLSGPSAVPALVGNVTANVARNVWSHTVIFCGHFPEGVATFTEDQIGDETRAQWYLRQIQGSANLEGSPLFHLMTGNLSHQIEHHLFPDLPSNRYAEIAPRVRALCAKYGVHYESGRLGAQYVSMWKRLIRLALPPRRSSSSLTFEAATRRLAGNDGEDLRTMAA
jgi:NADPH-dependent stearoyl-CoA 9-desaturase